LGTTVVEVTQQIIGYFPTLLGAVALLITGWLIALGVRALSLRLLKGLDRVWYRLVLKSGLPEVRDREFPLHILGTILFWVVILFFLTAATEVLGLRIFTVWLSKVVEYLPTILGSALIILAGVLISGLIRDLVSAGATSAGMTHGDLLGRVSQGIVLATVLVIGANQIGIDVTLLVIIFGIVAGSMLGAVALAFGLGARSFVSNLISAREVRRMYKVGDTIRIGETEGTISEITQTTLILESDNSRFVVPAKEFNDRISALLGAVGKDGDS
jgi:small-conductance mechanosensitive channel